ncbi:hypothetical protein GCM10027185_52760 [Spirosoma pulveris]
MHGHAFVSLKTVNSFISLEATAGQADERPPSFRTIAGFLPPDQPYNPLLWRKNNPHRFFFIEQVVAFHALIERHFVGEHKP